MRFLNINFNNFFYIFNKLKASKNIIRGVVGFQFTINYFVYKKINKLDTNFVLDDVSLLHESGFLESYYYDSYLEMYLKKKSSLYYFEFKNGLYNLFNNTFLTYQEYEDLRHLELCTFYRGFDLSVKYPHYFFACKNYFDIDFNHFNKPKVWFKFLSTNLLHKKEIKSFCKDFISFFHNPQNKVMSIVVTKSVDREKINFFKSLFFQLLGAEFITYFLNDININIPFKEFIIFDNITLDYNQQYKLYDKFSNKVVILFLNDSSFIENELFKKHIKFYAFSAKACDYDKLLLTIPDMLVYSNTVFLKYKNSKNAVK